MIDFRLKMFPSNDEMNDYMKSNNYGMEDKKALCFGVSFTKAEDGKYDYKMRYNLTLRPGKGDTSDFPETNNERILLTARFCFIIFQIFIISLDRICMRRNNTCIMGLMHCKVESKI